MRTPNELRAIHSAIWHAKELIELLDAHGSCTREFDTPELREMFYELNSMNCKLTAMREAIEADEEVEE